MNVAFDPWIPVVNTSGTRKLASLSEVLTEGEKFADLAVRPHERVSLMRLFLCVAHAALNGPKNYDEWCDVPKRLPDAAQTYLKYWDYKDSFELFHPEKPWLQVAELKGREKKDGKTGKTSPVALLDFELATGNNSTLFDHGGQMDSRKIESERIALNLLTFQNFSPGGGSPVAQWKTARTSQVGNPDAPCLSQSMAHCLFRGKSLAETINLNLPHYENIAKVYRSFSADKKKGGTYTDVLFGKPVWEYFPDLPDIESEKVVNATKTYLGRLVPISRWIRIIDESDQMYCCNGFKYSTFKNGFAAEPTGCVRIVKRKDKKGIETQERKVAGIHPHRAIWRELPALLIKRHADGIGGPLAMETAPHNTGFDFQVCVVMRDQASMDIAIESVFYVSPAFQANLAIYRSEVEHAESLSHILRRAIETYRTNIDNDWTPRIKRTQARDQTALKERLAQSAFLSYWTAIENNLSLLRTHIETVGSDAAIPTREAWRKMLFSAVCEAYRVACGRETPRQMRAFVKGWQKLTTKKGENKSDTNGTKEVKV